ILLSVLAVMWPLTRRYPFAYPKALGGRQSPISPTCSTDRPVAARRQRVGKACVTPVLSGGGVAQVRTSPSAIGAVSAAPPAPAPSLRAGPPRRPYGASSLAFSEDSPAS